MSMIRQAGMVAAAALVVAAVGCSSGPKPTADLAEAHTLVSQAEQSDAQQYASANLETARGELRQADQDAATDKPLLAARLAQEASVDAESRWRAPARPRPSRPCSKSIPAPPRCAASRSAREVCHRRRCRRRPRHSPPNFNERSRTMRKTDNDRTQAIAVSTAPRWALPMMASVTAGGVCHDVAAERVGSGAGAVRRADA